MISVNETPAHTRLETSELNVHSSRRPEMHRF